eukprot:79285-Amphidinium_carterae.1
MNENASKTVCSGVVDMAWQQTGMHFDATAMRDTMPFFISRRVALNLALYAHIAITAKLHGTPMNQMQTSCSWPGPVHALGS